MKKLILAGCISTLVACSNTNEFDANLDSKVTTPAAASQPSAVQTPGGAPMSVTNQPVVTTTTQPVVTNVPTTSTSTAPATVAKGMNPAHGQPGHRCDIPVGAPLNSPPNNSAKTTNGQNVTVTPTPVKIAPGMNPAHGQPGHRCDIAVGAPLNSAPATTPSQVVPVKPVETKPASTDQWKADVKPVEAAKKDSSGN